MAKQNIYDNETFFEGYKKIRDNKVNANNLFEIPALFSLLPDLKDKRILDLGCGFGEHCKEFVLRGASRVVGIDISEKMLAVAKEENSDPKITYIRMPMEEIDMIEEKFDVVISSLAFHYVEDFDGVLGKIHELLDDSGLLIFSQENPLSSTYSSGPRWEFDEDGNRVCVRLADYGREGLRESEWFVDNVKKYHRMFSTIANSLIDAGFTIERMIEPEPTKELLKEHPEYIKLYHKPDFLLVKAKKNNNLEGL